MVGTTGLILACFCLLPAAYAQQATGTALIRHAPSVNGTVQGSIQQMTAEGTTFNSGASLTGDLLVPGTPTVKLNGSPTYAGLLDGTGSTSPSNYQITLNSGVSLRHVIRRTDASVLAAVSAPPTPAGTRDVTLNSSGQSPGSFSTLRNLTLNSNVGAVAVPAGTYGSFTANSGSSFTLGIAGATQPAVYNLLGLTLNSGAQLAVVGPVTLTVQNPVTLSATTGASAHAGWLTLRVAGGGLTLNSGASFFGNIVAPNGTVTLNGAGTGGLIADRLTINSGGALTLLAAIPPPTVTLTIPVNNSVVAGPVNLTLTAAATSTGTIAKVAFYSGGTLLGTVLTPSAPGTYTLSYSFVAGTYSLTAVATDSNGAATTSAAALLVVDTPPAVTLTSPASGASAFTPGTVHLGATAVSPTQTINKVEFYQGATLLGTATTAPYQFAWINPAAGSYTLSAKAYDSLGIAATSSTVPFTIVADQPPVITLLSTGLVFPATSPVTLSFKATDTVTAVSKVEIYRTGSLVGTLTAPASGTTWTFAETAGLAPGTYTYVALAYDTNGSFTDSATVTVTVLPVLPYTTDFETNEGYVTGSLQGQQGWLVAPGSANITALDANHGTQSVQLPASSPPAILSQGFAPGDGESIEFFDFFAKPVAQTSPVPAATFTVESARFAFLKTGSGGTLQVFRGDGAGSGTWAPTAFTIPLTAQNQAASWIRLTARLDFTQKTWDLYANAQMIAADEPFLNNGSTSLALFQLQGDPTAPTGLDDIIAGPINPVFADVNNNGIDDAWEIAHGLSLSANNRNLSPAGNGVTVIQAYVGGTDPNDYYNGQAPQLSIVSGNNQTGAAGQFNAQPFVINVANPAGTAPLANAPVVFTVQSGGGKLALSGTGNPALSDTLTVRTDANGRVQVYYQQPIGPGTVSTINAVAGTASVVFTTSSLAQSQPPVVSLTSPAIGGSFTVPASIQLAATATDANGAVTKVEFYQGSTKLGESAAAPYQLIWSNVPAGTYTLFARAYNDAGATADSTPVVVIVTAIPMLPLQVSLAAYPQNNALAANRQFALVATASESPSGTTKLEFFNGSVKLGEALTSLGLALPDSYELVLPAGLDAGNYQITATATYGNGTVVTSAPLGLTIGGVQPWDVRTGFEPGEGFSAGVFTGNGDWQVTGGSAQIGQAAPYSGLQDLELPASAPSGVVLTRAFGGTSQDRITWFDLRIKPVVSKVYGSDRSTHIDTGAALVDFEYDNGQGRLLLGTNFDGISDQLTNYTFPVDASGTALNWIRITVRHDYRARTWDAYVDGVLISSDRETIDRSSQFSSVKITGAAAGTGVTAVDDVYAGPINPLFQDIDNDGMPDAWEIANGLNPLSNDRNVSSDGTRNILAYQQGLVLSAKDSDHNGLPDAWEMANFGHIGVDPSADPDHDGLTNRQEYLLGTDPNNPDTDGDGMPDGWEASHGLDPLNDDSTDDPDGDGFTNLQEYLRGTDPQDYFNGVIPALVSLVAADGSLGPGDSIAVRVTTPSGLPLANAPAVFHASLPTYRFAAAPDAGWNEAAAQVTVRADAGGVARAYITRPDQ